MSVRRIASTSVALALVGATADVSAQSSTTVHGVGSLSLAYTDNMLGAPSDPPPGQPGPVKVWYLEVSPGIAVIHQSPRALHAFRYTHPFTLYFGHSDANTQSDVAAWQGLFTLSPVDELTLGVTVERSNNQISDLQRGAGQTTATSRLAGDNILFQGRLSQGYTREISDQWTVSQTSGVATVIPLDVPTPQPNRYDFLVGVVPEYTSGRNAFALVTNATYFYTGEVDEGGVYADSSAQIILASQFRWRHDLSVTWSTELSGGLAAAMRADPLRGGVWGPVALGALRYSDEGYDAELLVNRTLGPDLIVAQTLLADQVLLSGGVPVDRENHIVFETGTGYSYNRVVEVEDSGYVVAAPFSSPDTTADNRVISTYGTWVVDAALGWYPEEAPYVTLRYQHLEQIGNDDDTAPTPSFHRNTVMLTTGMMWPPREVPEVPTGTPERVDGTDRDERLRDQREVRGTPMNR